ncbi:hypothetical protein RJT34_25499 [Clitoria ternatea]|uniref:Uncharacterized protein n=1 Tax=Clitoria ternatea TaxID=43366 RepID=A0AAN9IK20_CLITE
MSSPRKSSFKNDVWLICDEVDLYAILLTTMRSYGGCFLLISNYIYVGWYGLFKENRLHFFCPGDRYIGLAFNLLVVDFTGYTVLGILILEVAPNS